MSECTNCENLRYNIYSSDDYCIKGNPMIHGYGRLHKSVFPKCNNFCKGRPESASYRKVHKSFTNCYQDVIDLQHQY